MNTKNTAVYFRHPDREMLRNQLGLFIIESLRRYEEIRSNPTSDGLDKLIEDRVDKFMRILDKKDGF